MRGYVVSDTTGERLTPVLNKLTGKRYLTLKEICQKVFIERFETLKGNKSETARSLGVAPRTVRHWCKRLNLK
jgi:DNA-binding NtrC family response regulator